MCFGMCKCIYYKYIPIYNGWAKLAAIGIHPFEACWMDSNWVEVRFHLENPPGQKKKESGVGGEY
jgi:hypothetical protein